MIRNLPTLNAFLNATCGILLITGFVLIRRKKIRAHLTVMSLALTTSVIFLTSYLIYHYHAGSVGFTGQGWIRPVYFTILISHTILAAVIVPLVLVVLYRAVRGQFDRHRTLARWTLPLWLYVSVTGVLIYMMLYVWFPSGS